MSVNNNICEALFVKQDLVANLVVWRSIPALIVSDILTLSYLESEKCIFIAVSQAPPQLLYRVDITIINCQKLFWTFGISA